MSTLIHIYQGFCPDETQPNSRDPNCPVCQMEKRIKAAEKIFNFFGGLDELKQWENGQGESAKKVIEKYQKLKANHEANQRV